jgi:hypothetical protein
VDIYEVFIEVCPLAECSVISGNDVSGAFVSCFVAATDLEASIAAMKIRLADDKLQLLDLQSVARVNSDEWVPYDDNYPTREELYEIARRGDVAYGPFNCYTSASSH